MSPEQTRAEGLDRRSDIFSLGIVLFELTTGFRLFRGKDNRQTIELVRQARVPRPTQSLNDYPKALEAVVLKALQKDPARRFQTAEEFKAALEQYLRQERIVVAPAGLGALVKRVLGPRLEHHRFLIQEAVTALDAGPEARAAWLATPPSPGPQAVKSPVTETSASVQRTGSPIPPAPIAVAPRRSRLMSKSQVYWTLWAMCIAALSVYAWWLY
jgi:serine/threonine-protein kinase